MIIEKPGYSYRDLTVVPATISEISSRSECNPYIDDNKTLPIFTAPMASVVSEDNMDVFRSSGVIPIMPRNIPLDVRLNNISSGHWIALSLSEFRHSFVNNATESMRDLSFKICIDIANGHMISLYEACCDAKINSLKFGYNLTLMTGNIGNPETYRWICEHNCVDYEKKVMAVDYIRCGIGNGSGCTTTSNCSCHYPIASLIDACYSIKQAYSIVPVNYRPAMCPKIIADGGIRNYDHVIKALALGADYVMIGSLLAQCIESAGFKSSRQDARKVRLRFPIERYSDLSCDYNGCWTGNLTDEYIEDSLKAWKQRVEISKQNVEANDSDCNITEYNDALSSLWERKEELKKEHNIGRIEVKFFGMASADGQKSMTGEKTKTAEGITKWLPVKYTLAGWVDNMVSFLRSAMSYCGCKTLEEFIGGPDLIVNSPAEIEAVNK